MQEHYFSPFVLRTFLRIFYATTILLQSRATKIRKWFVACHKRIKKQQQPQDPKIKSNKKYAKANQQQSRIKEIKIYVKNSSLEMLIRFLLQNERQSYVQICETLEHFLFFFLFFFLFALKLMRSILIQCRLINKQPHCFSIFEIDIEQNLHSNRNNECFTIAAIIIINTFWFSLFDLSNWMDHMALIMSNFNKLSITKVFTFSYKDCASDSQSQNVNAFH